MGNYAGVDWASAKHDVVVQDEAGEELLAACSRTMRRGCGRCAARSRAWK
jgi:hypothetical protein